MSNGTLRFTVVTAGIFSVAVAVTFVREEQTSQTTIDSRKLATLQPTQTSEPVHTDKVSGPLSSSIDAHSQSDAGEIHHELSLVQEREDCHGTQGPMPLRECDHFLANYVGAG